MKICLIDLVEVLLLPRRSIQTRIRILIHAILRLEGDPPKNNVIMDSCCLWKLVALVVSHFYSIEDSFTSGINSSGSA